jgi:hypothetical protein
MKSFHEWVAERHPESIEEGFFKNLALGAALGAGAMGMGGKLLPKSIYPTTNRAAATARADEMDDDFDDEISSVKSKEAKLRAAADRVGIPKAQQSNLKGHMVGGVVVSVNGRKVRLTPDEAENVKFAQELARRMGN